MLGSFIDAQASLAAGQVVPAGDKLSAQSDALYARVRAAAAAAVDTHLDGALAETVKARFDSAVDRLTAQGLQESFRQDAIGSQGGALLAGQLRHVIEPILADTNRPIPNGLRLFGVDTSVPLGAKTFEARREYGTGSARVWGGSESELPTNSFSVEAQEFQVRNYVTSIIWDVFDEMNASFANVALAQKLVRIARDTLERFANEMIWFGDSRYRINGVLNYPWLDKELSDAVFAGTPADARATLTLLNGWMNKQHHKSKGVLGPTNVVTTSRVADWINQTPMGTATAMRDRTIGEVWMAGQQGRLQGGIEIAWELEDILGEGYDGMLFYRSDERGIQNVMPGGGIRALPLFSDDLKRRQIFWMAHGGIVMWEAGNMLLVVIKATE